MVQLRTIVLTIAFTAAYFWSEAQPLNNPDTIKANGYTLIFSQSDSVEMTDIFGDGAFRRKIEDSLPNGVDAELFIEQYLSKKFRNYFITNDSVLTLFLDNGKPLIFRKWDVEKDEGYIFEHYFSNIDYILLRVQWGEGNEWMLVNRKNGFKKNVMGRPYISPSLKKILCVNSTMPGYGDSGMELLSISGDTLKTEFKVLKDWGTTAAKWITDNSVIIENDTTADDVNGRKVYYVTTINR